MPVPLDVCAVNHMSVYACPNTTLEKTRSTLLFTKSACLARAAKAMSTLSQNKDLL